MTNVVRRWPALLLLSLLTLLLSSSDARAQQVSVNPVAVEVAASGDTVQATFKLEVGNNESSAMTNFFVFFEDGTYVSLGDIAPGAKVVSDAVTQLINPADTAPSKSAPVQLTLKYSIDGVAVEQRWPVAVQISE